MIVKGGTKKLPFLITIGAVTKVVTDMAFVAIWWLARQFQRQWWQRLCLMITFLSVVMSVLPSEGALAPYVMAAYGNAVVVVWGLQQL